MGSYREISELSKTLNYTVAELKKTEALQHELIANVSHDLRTPLTMITAYSEIMRDIPGENSPENVQVVIDEANRLTNLVNDMLDISKLQAGVDTLEAKEYNLTAGIKSVIDRYARLVEQYGYKVIFKYAEEDIMVRADLNTSDTPGTLISLADNIPPVQDSTVQAVSPLAMSKSTTAFSNVTSSSVV